MNVEAATLQVDYWKAETAYREYRALVQSGRGTPEDEQLRRAYREIKLGRKVIDVNLAITGAGCTPQGMPKLAIARADWPFVFAWWNSNSGPVYFAGHQPQGWKSKRYMEGHNVGVRMPRTGSWDSSEGKAQVPMIPPAHRPKGALSGYRILFEAVWIRQPPVDPLLLRHIDGPFYVVLAAWDLSDVEQAVLRARLQS